MAVGEYINHVGCERPEKQIAMRTFERVPNGTTILSRMLRQVICSPLSPGLTQGFSPPASGAVLPGYIAQVGTGDRTPQGCGPSVERRRRGEWRAARIRPVTHWDQRLIGILPLTMPPQAEGPGVLSQVDGYCFTNTEREGEAARTLRLSEVLLDL